MFDSVKRRFLDLFVNHALANSRKHATEYKVIQEETNRKEERVMRYDIYEEDVRFAGNGQSMYSYTVKVKDGMLTKLDNGITPDVVVSTDIPTVEAFASGKFTQIFADGTRHPIEPFTTMDAVRLGRLKWDGPASVLKELNLFQMSILPKLEKELRLR